MPLSNNYNPKDNETKIYSQWMDTKIGNPELQKVAATTVSPSSQILGNCPTHAILMPPPNLTGDLHAGHAFQHYLMDTLSRLARQRGEKNLWFPGVDHAGLQLEGVIDKLIKKGEFDEIINKGFVEAASESPLTEIENLMSKSREDLPKYLKTNYPELWLECAWSKVNLWRDNQKNQSAILGDTPDYDRSLFTLDPQNLDMVNYAFIKYWQDGLIYKGSYLVNWSVGLMTALSDVAGEIEYEKRIDPFVTFQYAAKRIEFKSKEIETKYSHLLSSLKPFENWKRLNLSTVRPETKFTDLGVVMHPTKFDDYYNENIFQNITDQNLANDFLEDIRNKNIFVFYYLPVLESQDIKLLFSDKVDPDFGTGLVKLTPGHDLFDYNLYNEFVTNNELPAGLVQLCIGRDGKLNAEYCKEFSGLTVEQARPPILKRLVEADFVPKKTNFEGEIPSRDNLLSDSDFRELKLEKQIEYLKDNYSDYQIDWNYEHNVTICERTKTVVEPLISEEFFISYHKEFNWEPIAKDLNKTIINQNKKTNLQKLGIEAVNATNFHSPEYKERGINFLENIKDWCISRDLIWGHKMPVWYNLGTNPDRKFYSFEEFQQENTNLSKGFKVEGFGGIQNNHFAISVTRPTTPGNWVQEEKILDTWFSSCLWPLSTLKYPDFVKNQSKQSNVVLIHGGEVWKDKETYRNKIESGELNWLWYKFNQSSKTTFKSDLIDFCQENNISIINPQMPNKTNADYTKWKMVFEQTLPYINSNSILVGHSLGSMFLTKYLNENVINCKAVFLVSGGLWSDSESNIEDFDTKWGLDNNFEKINKLGNIVHIVHSKDDKVVDFQRSLDLKSKLPDANLIELDNFGHLNVECEELLKLIKGQFKNHPLDKEGQSVSFGEIQNDFATFYPTQEMTTGKDIFYQWIVRMTTLSYYFTAQIPYENLVITPTILDDKGKKMSKSLGNGMDPVAQINKYSSDSMRMAMLGGMIPDRNIKMGGRLADELCEKYRNFGNKMWNIARFFEYQVERSNEK
jgi:valyl-tRNA synthetase/predicted alpha/beta hydrolase family esterase